VLVAAEPDSYSQNGSVAFAAEAVWELRDAQLGEQLLPAALALVQAEAGDWYMTSNELTVARLATVVGRLDQAREFFDRARARLAERRQLPLCAIVDYNEALALRASRQPDAARLMADAMDGFAELGMHAWSAEAPSTQRDRGAMPDGLTAREAQILTLLSTGRTNKEIAAELVISVHTVERHLQTPIARSECATAPTQRHTPFAWAFRLTTLG
jgi:DNA-binding CsgD family transcriptional regulator